MINPLTFESNGDDQYLTWSRDDASVMDAIFSSRTSSQMLDKTNGIWSSSAEIVGRGSSQICLTEFSGYIDAGGNTTIRKMRGYIAGRYFEIENEKGNYINPNNGAGLLMLRAIGFAKTTNNVMFTNAGYYISNASINDNARDLNNRNENDIIGRVLVWFDTDSYPSRLRLTPQDTQDIPTNINEGPYMLKPEFNTLLKYYNDQQHQLNFLGDSGFSARGEYLNNDDRHTNINGDKDTGDIALLWNNTRKPTIKPTKTTINPPKKGCTFNFSSEIYNGSQTPLKDLYGSAYFGKVTTPNFKTDYNPKLKDLVTDMYNARGNIYTNPNASASLSFNVANLIGGINIVNRGVYTSYKGNRMMSQNGWGLYTNVDDSAAKSCSILFAKDLRMNDIYVSIDNIEYLTSRDNKPFSTSVVVPIPYGRSENFVKVSVRINLYNVKISTQKDLTGQGANDNLGISDGYMNTPTYTATFLVPLSIIGFYTSNDGGNRFRKSSTTFGDTTEQEFKNLISKAGYTEREYLTRVLKPYAGVYGLYQILDANIWTVTGYFQRVINQLLESDSKPYKMVHFISSVAQLGRTLS